MKKVLLGCGILVLAGLGFLGWLCSQLYPHYKVFAADGERFVVRLADLEQRHPFGAEPTSLDRARFAAALDLRVELRQLITERWHLLDERLEDQDQNTEMGTLARFVGQMGLLAEMFGQSATLAADRLEAAAMGPREFSWHCRLLWATLESVGAGAGDEDTRLHPLRSRSSDLKTAYEKMRHDDSDLPALEELVGSFDGIFLAAARDVLADDTERVEQGFAHPLIETRVYLSMSEFKPEELVADVSKLQLPADEPREDR